MWIQPEALADSLLLESGASLESRASPYMTSTHTDRNVKNIAKMFKWFLINEEEAIRVKGSKEFRTQQQLHIS